MTKGKIIFLNGVSSTGKSTLARTLQNKLTEHFYWLDYDNFIHMAVDNPKKVTDPHTFFQKSKDPVTILFHTIKMYSDFEINVIAEGCLFRPFPREIKAYDFCVDLLHGYPVLSVLVTCPTDELRRRERKRGDRHVGEGEQRLSNVDPSVVYDITVDTFNDSTDKCADKIIELLNCPDKFSAFKNLRSQRVNI